MRLVFRAGWIALAWTLVLSAGSAGATSLTPSQVLGNWTNEKTPADIVGGDSASANTNWQIQSVDATDVLYTGGNLSGSLISNFTTSGDFVFSGQFSTVSDGDKDLIGFAFGWQAYDDTHFVAWGGHAVDRWNGNYHISERDGETYSDILKTHSHWTAETWYDFSVERTGSTYRVTTSLGSSPVVDHSFVDATLDGGRIGIQVHSQASYFRNLTFVPEPSTALLLGLGLVGMSLRRRHSR